MNLEPVRSTTQSWDRYPRTSAQDTRSWQASTTCTVRSGSWDSSSMAVQKPVFVPTTWRTTHARSSAPWTPASREAEKMRLRSTAAASTTAPSDSRAGTGRSSTWPKPSMVSPLVRGAAPKGVLASKYSPAHASRHPEPTSAAAASTETVEGASLKSSRAMARGTYSASVPEAQSTTAVPSGRPSAAVRRSRSACISAPKAAGPRAAGGAARRRSKTARAAS
mmetsp:Transcript_12067/g.41012  ORF Transcript_12067/g.41012 Transcript_12067/m.41012 type:complete len:222 (+) Transcript_12067:1414-2079(+)